MTYRVLCHDGLQRHDAGFATIHDAEVWAWWGHVCDAKHTIEHIATGATHRARPVVTP